MVKDKGWQRGMDIWNCFMRFYALDSSRVVFALAQSKAYLQWNCRYLVLWERENGENREFGICKIIVFNNTFFRFSTLTLSKVGTFNTHVSVDLDLETVGVSMAWTHQLWSPPKFSFWIKFVAAQTPTASRSCLWSHSFGIKTCFLARTFCLERGTKDLTVNKYKPPNGMHGALFKEPGLFEISSPIKSKWAQKHLESRDLCRWRARLSGCPWPGYQGSFLEPGRLHCSPPHSPGLHLRTRKSEPLPFAVAPGSKVGGHELTSQNNPGQSGSVSRLMN